ncbi:MAG: hypothetical protein V5804_12560 [Mucilaginibacter sp.]|uniref:hypothetical protein n=1 Tax=Mucilaginibacter sp. TaxID=1882438 RepID=UPI0034E3F20D
MNKQAIIEQTVKAINQLPQDKAEEISEFTNLIIKRYEEQKLTEGIQQIITNSQTFDFLNEEEDLYSESDLKEIYSND